MLAKSFVVTILRMLAVTELVTNKRVPANYKLGTRILVLAANHFGDE